MTVTAHLPNGQPASAGDPAELWSTVGGPYGEVRLLSATCAWSEYLYSFGLKISEDRTVQEVDREGQRVLLLASRLVKA